MPRISSPWGNIFCKFGKEAALCLDKTIIYTRDAGGNVTQKKVYALSTQANYTHSVGDGYGYSKLSINFPEIMAVAALVIYAPGVLGAIETIGAVISIFD